MQSNPEAYGSDWTDREIDLVVADYFEMRRMELLGQPYVKSHRNAALRGFVNRSAGSIEFKHQNISAVMVELGEPWIYGYKPLANFQKSLIEGVERFLLSTGDTIFTDGQIGVSGFAEGASIFLEDPPKKKLEKSDLKPEIRRILKKFDPATRDARNRKLGRIGEEIIFRSEVSRLNAAGRNDLASRVRWVAAEDGDGAGYDIYSFDQVGRERLLEVKTTRGENRTPFFLTRNELELSGEGPDQFRIVRLYDAARTPKAFEIVPPLQDWVNLTATEFQDSF